VAGKSSKFLVRLKVFLEGARERGFVRTVLGRLVSAVAALSIWVALLPITILLHLAGYRRLTVITGRIGHLAAEVDCFLKARALGELPTRRWFLLAPRQEVANTHLLDYWRGRVPVISHPGLCLLLGAMSRWLFLRHDVSHYMLRLNETQDIYRINAAWNGRPPILSLVAEDEEWGQEKLREVGLPEDSWFVCVHMREPGFSPADDAEHAHRNGRPEALIPAMEEIVRRGGWCIRMGDASMSRLPLMDGVIDYAHHRLRSGRMDVILCAKARFFLGNSSGLALVSSVFGVPCALANMIPMSALSILPGDLSIHKLLRLDREDRLLAFDEVLGSEIGNYRYARLYANRGITPLENSPEVILDLVKEMLDRLDGMFTESDADMDLQKRFFALMRPGHYSYGAASRVGAMFLRKYRHLFVT
jgi:putative glycosyltransferase (TIGR04372 family)